ncbi:hypothetical protein AMTRI_Chr08g164670 [Amborella trichopoda]|uniref:uncharacterized protein LOC18433134 n=1 Tax=Amborella trichopoda TaxID=13333 RepID=UPI0005D39095|nr:uncharacterized protein LOC18433134 [Amborella trichopoda]|eukprot:XP_011622938.1 uncharacterized protein LOC18433134 [Amborella trichopoda]
METDGLDVLVTEQKKEVMDAASLSSDLDLAFRLQMEEAMGASRNLQTLSSSSLKLTSSLPSSSSSTVSEPPLASTLKISEEEEDMSYALRLQALEIEKFEQEKKDGFQSQEEIRRLSDQIRVVSHDAKFARAVKEMPDEEWEDTGDWFEDPIEPSREYPFRLYFKGMISNEYVQGSWKSLSAMGIVICDGYDNVVLEIEKAGENDLRRGVAEAKSLIEGLTAALSLNIRQIDVYCDYATLINQVQGRWNAKGQLGPLIDQVRLLRKKFDSFHMYLVTRTDIKFSFRLARRAIDSQLTKATNSNASNTLKQTCSICLEDTDVSQMFMVDGCAHRYCFSCMRQHVEVQLSHGVLPGCPHEGCKTNLNVDSSRKFLPTKLIEIMIQRLEEAAIPETDKLYCPYPKCSALMSKREMQSNQQASSSSHHTADSPGLRRCIKCQGPFCLNCIVPWHSRMTCWQYKIRNPYPHTEDEKLRSLANRNLWRQCVKCKHMIELAEGCYHMTCRCGYEFCYTCGAQWRNKKPTCSCKLWDEHNIVYDELNEEEDDDDHDEYYDEEDDSDSEFEEIHYDGTTYLVRR